MGPIGLGDSRTAVEARIGKPVAEAAVTDSLLMPRRYRAALYVFPGTTTSRNGRLRFRMTELLYYNDQIAAINDSPGARIDNTRCSTRFANDPLKDVEIGVVIGPFLRFDGIKIGDRLVTLSHLFGRAPGTNRSKDWYSYWPIPITFDADPDTQIIDGIAIAMDEQAGSVLAMPLLHVRRDPATCKPLSITFALKGS